MSRGYGEITLDEDSENLGQLIFSDADTSRDALAVLIEEDVQNGSLELLEDGEFIYRPDADFFGTDSFTYRISDGELESELATIDITVNPVNDLPEVAQSDFTTDEDTILTGVNILDNAEDVDGDDLTVVAARTAAGVALAIGVETELDEGGLLTVEADGSVTFNPNSDFEALAFNPQPEPPAITIQFDVSDGSDFAVEGTFTIAIDGVNDAPEAEDATFNVAENTTAVGQVVASDVDSDTLTYTISGGADVDLFAVDENTGDVSFITAPDFEANGSAAGNNTYEVVVSASDGELSDDATLTVEVTDEDENAPINVIQGENNTGLEVLTGTDGADIIFSGGGFYDIVTGGADADTFVFGGGAGDGQQNMVITDFEAGVDALDLGGQGVFFDFSSASTTYLYLDGGDFDLITVNGVSDIDDITFVEDTVLGIV